MKRLMITLLMVAFMISGPTTIWANPQPIVEPELMTRLGWDLTPAGLLTVSFDLDQNGRPDYFTLRVVASNYFSKDTLQTVAESCPENLIFYVNYGTKRYYYIASQEPLFYVFDVDEDGAWDLMYKDVSEDGINGNEQFYDSPSGKFSAQPLTE